MMNATHMIDLMNRVPFKPFEIHLTDGARVRVEEPYIVIAEGDVFLTKSWKSIRPRIKHGLNTDPNNQRIASKSVFNPCFIRGQGFRLAASPRYRISTARNSPTCTVYDNDERARMIAYFNITEAITAAHAG